MTVGPVAINSYSLIRKQPSQVRINEGSDSRLRLSRNKAIVGCHRRLCHYLTRRRLRDSQLDGLLREQLQRGLEERLQIIDTRRITTVRPHRRLRLYLRI